MSKLADERFKRRQYTVRLGDLTGPGGNPYAIMATVTRQLHQQGVEHAQIERFLQSLSKCTYAEILDKIDATFFWADVDECGLNPAAGWTRDDD